MSKDAEIAKFEELFREHYAPLSRYVLRMSFSPEDTVEIVQESFLRLWAGGDHNSIEQTEPALLFRFARNLAIDRLRHAKCGTGSRRGRRQTSGHAADPEQVAIVSDRQRLADAALRQLDPKQRETLRLRAAGFSYREIAEILAVNPESIGPTLTRALRRFREAHESLSRGSAKGGRNETTG